MGIPKTALAQHQVSSIKAYLYLPATHSSFIHVNQVIASSTNVPKYMHVYLIDFTYPVLRLKFTIDYLTIMLHHYATCKLIVIEIYLNVDTLYTLLCSHQILLKQHPQYILMFHSSHQVREMIILGCCLVKWHTYIISWFKSSIFHLYE